MYLKVEEEGMKTQWEIYRELELISDSADDSSFSFNSSVLVSKKTWPAPSELARLLGQILTGTQVIQHRVLHLESCLNPPAPKPQAVSPWQTIWTSIFRLGFIKTIRMRPRIDFCSEGGCIYWYGYKPATGEMIFLETQDEAKCWLEKQIVAFED
jgi:hypothetical protein